MASNPRPFVVRMVLASLLDRGVYEEIESDPSAMGQAVAVVLLSSVATVVGGLTQFRAIELLNAALLTVVGWFLCGTTVYLVGTRLLPEPQTRADLREVLRVTAFSSAPGLLRVAGLIPFAGRFVYVATGVWMLVAMVVAVRQTLDYRSTWRALVVAVIAWVLYVAPLAIGLD